MKAAEQDKKILRDLAKKVAELAALPVQNERRRLWYKHNALKGEKPMVLVFPEGGWTEIMPDSTLQTSDEVLRQWERRLRQTIYTQEHFKDDQVAEPVFDIPSVCPFSDWGVREELIRGKDRGSYRWDPPVKKPEDIEKLHPRTVTFDREETKRQLDLANEIFGDILEVRRRGALWWTVGMTMTLIFLRGLDQAMIDMYDNPELLHRLMGFIRDSTLSNLEFLEKEGALDLNNEGDYVGSGGLGYTNELPAPDFDGKARTKDMWVLGESQEFVGVSPEMFDEFALQYQMPILEKFGLVCYGCCEPLDHKFELIKKIPHLRRVSVSPWCSLEKARDALEDKYIFSWKPNPAHLAAPAFDEDALRSYIKNAVDVARDCILEIILKDTHTCKNDPSRFDKWARIAREVANG